MQSKSFGLGQTNSLLCNPSYLPISPTKDDAQIVYKSLKYELSTSKKALILNFTAEWYHWGCSGTSFALLEQIQKLGYETCALSLITNLRYDEPPQSFEEFDLEERFQKFCKTNPLLKEEIQNCDVVVVNAEGTLHNIASPVLRLLYLIYIAKTKFTKNVQIINGSLYPTDFEKLEKHSLEYKVYKHVLQNVDFLALREEKSYQNAEKLKMDPFRLRKSFDCLPLYIKNHYKRAKNPPKNRIVFTGSIEITTLLHGKDETKKQAQEAFVQLIEYLQLMHDKGCEIICLFGSEGIRAKDDELLFHYLQSFGKISKDHPDSAPWKFIDAKSLTEWLNVIENATLFISGRFHHTIACLCLQTPFIVFESNTPKISAILEEFTLPGPLTFLQKNNKQALLERTAEIFEPHLQQLVPKDALEILAKKALVNFEGLQKLIT